MQEYPGIELRLISSIWTDELAVDETDIDLRLGFGNWPRCRAREVLRDRVTAVCHPRLARAIGQVADLAAHPLIHVMGIEDLWMKYFDLAGLGLEVKREDIRVDSAIAALEIAASGRCVALIQQRFLDQYLKSRRLVAPLDITIDMEQAIYLVEAESRAQPKPEAILFGEWLDRIGEA